MLLILLGSRDTSWIHLDSPGCDNEQQVGVPAKGMVASWLLDRHRARVPFYCLLYQGLEDQHLFVSSILNDLNGSR
jgi:hypothetical protein